MAQTSLRFVHAAHLRLDAPLRTTGSLSADMRRLAEDATLIAWERVVDACLERSADFLLLTGTTLDQPPTIRARRAFIEGCSALAEFDIAVLVSDPLLTPAVWSDFGLPVNVRILDGTAPASWANAGGITVTITHVGMNATADATATMSGRFEIDEQGDAFAIALAGEAGSATDQAPAGAAVGQFNYCALDCWSPHQSVADTGTALHAPGTSQGVRASETGPRGCSLVEVDAERRIDITPLPTAPIRWEEFDVRVAPATSLDELVERMQLALLDREASVGERLWIVRWRLKGSGALFESLSDDRTFRELCQAVEAGLGGKAGAERMHRRELNPDLTGDDDALIRQFAECVSGIDPLREPVFADLERIGRGGVGTALDALDVAGIRAAAGRLGRTWLNAALDGTATK